MPPLRIRAFPDTLAATVLDVSRGFVTDDLRTFAGIGVPVAVPADAKPADQLAAFMGRHP